MKRLWNSKEGIEKFFCRVFNVLAIIMYAILFWNGLRLTGQNYAEAEYILFRDDSIVFNLFCIGVALIVLCLVDKITGNIQGKIVRNIVLGVVCLLTVIFSIYWVSTCGTAPCADQNAVCFYADQFNLGDYSSLNRGGYMARFPQQLGMVTLLRGLFLIFGQYHYQAFQYLMALLVPLIVVSGCMIVRILSNDNVRAEFFYFIFILTCFPMYIYTAFVYGDLISTALGLFCVWMYLLNLKKFSWVRLLLLGISMGIAVQLRENIIILAIAMAIVMLLKLCIERNWKSLMTVVVFFMGIFFAHVIIQEIYSDVVEEKGDSIPPLLYIVMGLNDADDHPGWFNGYNMMIFGQAGDDPQLAIATAQEHLQEIFQGYRQFPGYMRDFFKRKMNAQWNAPMYQCIAMNNFVVDSQGKIAANITHYGKVAKLMESYMKVYQLLLYGNILFLLVVKRKETAKLEKYVLLIAVYGGFLFSLIWEAKTRYVLPFLFMQIPYMAMGISETVVLIEKWFNWLIRTVKKILIKA